MTPFCDEAVADREREAAEHADAELVDVERVVLGEREAVAGGLVELVELGELVGIAASFDRAFGQQLLALADCLPVQQLGILGVVQADEAGDARHRDRLVLPPWDVSEVVDGVAAPPELLEERRELLVERSTVVGLVERGHDLVRRRLRRKSFDSVGLSFTIRLSAHIARLASTERVWKPCSVWYASVGLGRLHDLVVHVAERAAGQEHEVDVPVDPPLVGMWSVNSSSFATISASVRPE